MSYCHMTSGHVFMFMYFDQVVTLQNLTLLSQLVANTTAFLLEFFYNSMLWKGWPMPRPHTGLPHPPTNLPTEG